MDSQQQLTQGQQQLGQDQKQQVTQAQQQLTQRQHMAQVSEHPSGMLTPAEAPPPPPASASNAFNSQPSKDHLVGGQHVAHANNAAMDHDGSASGSFGTTAVSSMAEAAGQMPEAGEAMLSDSMVGDAQDVTANGMLGETAEAMLGEDGAAQDVEANSISAESEMQSAALGSSEAAAADGHPPQMAVLASLDQVCMPFAMAYPTCLQHALLNQVRMLPFTMRTPKQLLDAFMGHSGHAHACTLACRQADLCAQSLGSPFIMPV